jgi:hypothetical protein
MTEEQTRIVDLHPLQTSMSSPGRGHDSNIPFVWPFFDIADYVVPRVVGRNWHCLLSRSSDALCAFCIPKFDSEADLSVKD